LKPGRQNSTAGWLLPYLALAVLLLGMVSWALGKYLLPQIPLWGHLLAIALATGALALTLYALRRAGMIDDQ